MTNTINQICLFTLCINENRLPMDHTFDSGSSTFDNFGLVS